ncbi:MAG: hypothetical protein SXQ77_11680 [Halobacteria archaeon]|nr:hypothetical protein [Halobacteria archaeon]
MTRKAVKDQFDVYVNEIIDGAFDQMSMWGVFHYGIRNLPGKHVFKLPFRPIINEDLAYYRSSYNNQFKLTLEYAGDIVNGEADFDEYRDQILAFDAFYQAFECDDKIRRVFEYELVERFRSIGRDIAPVYEHPSDDFWEATMDVYDYEEVVDVYERNFKYGEVLKKYQGCMNVPSQGMPDFVPVTITKEAVETAFRGEQFLLSKINDKLHELYVENRRTDLLET